MATGVIKLLLYYSLATAKRHERVDFVHMPAINIYRVEAAGLFHSSYNITIFASV